MSLSTKRILLVEDEPLLAEIITAFLEMEGITVEITFDQAETLERLSRTELPAIDGLISDVNLVDGSGFEIARHFRQLGADLPVILISGELHDTDNFPEQNANGRTVFLKKPFAHSDLINTLKTLY